MSRKVLILNLITGGVEFGRVVLPSEMMSLQDFAHAHVEVVARDLLMRNATGPMVAGFDRTLTGLLNISVAAGHVMDAQGLSYETLPAGQATAVTLAPAHATLPRIDLVYVTLSANQDAESTALPHRRLLTSAEVAAGADPYPIENQTVNTQRQNRAVVAVKQGTPASSPVAQAAGANEVALYQVLVPAAATVLAAGNVTDVRVQMRSLRDAWVQIDANVAALAALPETIDDRVAALVVLTQNTGLAWVYNDALNQMTLAGVAASGAAMGMMSVADFNKLAAATAAKTASTLAMRDTSGDLNVRRFTAQEGTNPYSFAEPRAGEFVMVNAAAATALIAVAASTGNAEETNRALRAVARFPSGSNNGTAIAVDALAEGLPASSPTGANLYALRGVANNNTGGAANRFAVYGEAQGGGGGSNWAGYFTGNVNATGNVTKAGGTFHIDHVLEEMARTHFLDHSFVESAECLLIYRGRVKLSEGRARVNIDEHYRLTAGTFAALTQNADVHSLVNRTGFARVRATEVEGAEFGIVCEDSASEDEVTWTVYAERDDPYIRASSITDGDGHLICEYEKPDVPAEVQAEALKQRVVTVEADEEADDEEREEAAAELAGARGRLLHPEARGEKALTRKVVVKTRRRARRKEGDDEGGGGRRQPKQ